MTRHTGSIPADDDLTDQHTTEQKYERLAAKCGGCGETFYAEYPRDPLRKHPDVCPNQAYWFEEEEGMATPLKEQPPEPDHTDPKQVERDLNAESVTIHEQGEKPGYKK